MSLPAHTPSAGILACTYGEPDAFAHDTTLTNRQKVENARTTLGQYLPLVASSPGGVQLPEADENWDETDGAALISDLIADLLHLACFSGLDPEEMARCGMRDFSAEAGLGYEQ